MSERRSRVILSLASREMVSTEKVAVLQKRQNRIGGAIAHESIKQSSGRYWASRDIHERGESVSVVMATDLDSHELKELSEFVGEGFEKILDSREVDQETILGIGETVTQIYMREYV